MSDDFLFADETSETDTETQLDRGTWKILVVDDEPEVHAVTKLALSDFSFIGKGLEFMSAYSGEEAKKVFQENEDIAVVLLDVVMETDDAGLRVAEFIRNEANNHFTRIILRTGQPGQAPEKDVILNYDINDYKSKTELTAQKLFTVVVATLRSYRDIIVIEENRKGLEKIISASANLFSIRSLESFIEGLLQQLTSLLGGTTDAAYLTSAVAGPQPLNQSDPKDFVVFTGKGEYANKEGTNIKDVVSGEQLETCHQALQDKSLVYGDDYLAAYCNSKSQKGSLLYLSGLPRKLNEVDKHLVAMFTQNVQIAFDNVLLTKDVEDSQRDVIQLLGQALEQQFSQGKNISRMVKLCELLGSAYQLNSKDIETLKLAVPLHDVGKLKIPESIFKKAEKLTEEELQQVKSHAEFGYEILKNSDHHILQVAAELARDHHEHWDGNGYPRQLKGEEINIFSRITAIADVYDALRSKRCHKPAWSPERVKAHFIENRGKQFDPSLVDLLVANIDEAETIMHTNPDQMD